MQRIAHRQKIINQNSPQKTHHDIVHSPLGDFFRKAVKKIQEKSEMALDKLQLKLAETPAVFVLPLENRKKMESQVRVASIQQSEASRSRSKNFEKDKSISHLGAKQEQKLKQLMRRKQQLMSRLKRIDQQLHNPYTSSQPTNESYLSIEYEKGQALRPVESRINFKQGNTYNVVQHQRTMEMLSRLNNEKMRRQEKIVSELRKKQALELRNLQQIQKNKSQMFNSRQTKPLNIHKNINKRNSQKLHEIESPSIDTQSNQKQYKKQEIENQFDVIQDIQIGSTETKQATIDEPNDLHIIVQ